jgi:hypothetical protein
MKIILLTTLILNFTVFAQITITSTDIASQYIVGNAVVIHESENPSTADIGVQGGGNLWDFSTLTGEIQASLTCVNPASTPYNNDFPGATIATHTLGMYAGETGEIWQYATTSGGLDNLGTAVTVNSQPGVVTMTKNSPARREFELPLNYNSSWTNSYTQTISINGIPFPGTAVSTSFIVDAYGTMILPGGSSFDALRLKESLTVAGMTSVSYLFISKSGAQVSLFASEPNPPLSGVINIEGYIYNETFGFTDVEEENKLLTNFSIDQNYPNPFNPSTKIKYTIPNVSLSGVEGSRVQLKVYDVLGNEVATLVNEYKPAGSYEVEFDAENLSSGIYFYKLRTGDYTSVKKMILLK